MKILHKTLGPKTYSQIVHFMKRQRKYLTYWLIFAVLLFFLVILSQLERLPESPWKKPVTLPAVSPTEPPYVAYTFDPSNDSLSAFMHQHSLSNSEPLYALNGAIGANKGKCGQVVDVGAGFGLFGLYALHRSCEYVSFFEMQSNMSSLLEKSLTSNQWTDRAAVHTKAVGALEEGTSVYYIPNTTNSGSVSLWTPVRPWGQPPPGSMKATIVRLDSPFLQFSSKKIFFLNIDTQGYEMEVLDSCWELLRDNSVKHITLRLTPSQVDVLYTLYSYGYGCRSVRGLTNLYVGSLLKEFQTKEAAIQTLESTSDYAIFWCSPAPPQPFVKKMFDATQKIADTRKPPAEPTRHMRKLRVLVAHPSLPLFDWDGTNHKFFLLLEELRLDGHEIEILCYSDEHVSASHLMFYTNRAGYKIHSINGDSQRYKDGLSDILQHDFQIFLFSLNTTPAYQKWVQSLLHAVKAAFPSIATILFSDVIYHKHLENLIDNKQPVPPELVGMKQVELDFYKELSMVIASNSLDQLTLLSLVPPTVQVTRLGYTIYTSTEGPAPLGDEHKSWGSRHGLLFVGSNTPENRQALEWFFAHGGAWTQLLGKWRNNNADLILHIAGSVEVPVSARNDPKVFVHGLVSDAKLDELMRKCRVFVSPMQLSMGMNKKHVRALRNALPIVSTWIGLQHMELPMGNTDYRISTLHCWHAYDAGCFVNHIYELYYDKWLWNFLMNQGQKHYEAFFSLKSFQNDVDQILSLADPVQTPLPSEPPLPLAVKRTDKIFIATMLYESARILGRFSDSLLKLIDLLGRENVFVSLITTSGGRDRTTEMLETLKTVLEARHVKVALAITKSDREGYKKDRVSFLANERNIALHPLTLPENDMYTKVLFINDIVFEPHQMLRLIDTPVYYDMVCGMDFSYATMNIFPNGTINDDGPPGLRFYDAWVTRSMTGNLIQNPIPFSTDYDRGFGEPWLTQNWDNPAPVQVSCCWNGAVVFRASAVKNGIRFRGAKDWECPSSECTWWCKDLISEGYDQIYVNPAVRFAYESTVWNDLKQFPSSPYDGALMPTKPYTPSKAAKSLPNKAICCPAEGDGAHWDKCHWAQSLASQGKKRKFSIAYEGPIYDPTDSFAVVNRNLLTAFSQDPDLLLTIFPTDTPQKVDPRWTEDWQHLSGLVGAQNFPLEADVWIRSRWPANMQPTSLCCGKCRLVVFQPWEFGSVPKEWSDAIGQHIWRVWVPTTEVKKMYVRSAVDAKKVQITPHGVNLAAFYSDPAYTGPQLLDIKTQKKFKFLFHGGLLERKGIDVLFKAYLKEFKSSDDVSLIVHYTYSRYADDYERYSAWFKVPDAPEVVWLKKTLSNDEVALMYKSVDALVLPYRSEGFGLPIVEAMASRLPVIVIDKGAATDFTSNETAFLVSSQETQCTLYPCEGKSVCVFCDKGICACKETVVEPSWYEPSLDSLAKVMRYVETHPEERKKRSDAAFRLIQGSFTWKAVSNRILNELKLAIKEEESS